MEDSVSSTPCTRLAQARALVMLMIRLASLISSTKIWDI